MMHLKKYYTLVKIKSLRSSVQVIIHNINMKTEIRVNVEQ